MEIRSPERLCTTLSASATPIPTARPRRRWPCATASRDLDEGTTHSDTIIDYNKVSSFQINLSSRFENKLLPYDLIIVRNHGDDDKDVGGGVWRRGGPARAAKPSWRPNPSRV